MEQKASQTAAMELGEFLNERWIFSNRLGSDQMKIDIEASQASVIEAKEATEVHKAELAKLNKALASTRVCDFML